jgi:hypothetical protein
LPITAANGHQRETFICVNQFTVGNYVKALALLVNAAEHIACITALAHLARTPLGKLCWPPSQPCGANGVEM